MPNWYQKQQNKNVSKYRVNLDALVTVPLNMDKEKEEQTAMFVLNKYLPESTDASVNTAIESTVDIDVREISPYV